MFNPLLQTLDCTSSIIFIEIDRIDKCYFLLVYVLIAHCCFTRTKLIRLVASEQVNMLLCLRLISCFWCLFQCFYKWWHPHLILYGSELQIIKSVSQTKIYHEKLVIVHAITHHKPFAFLLLMCLMAFLFLTNCIRIVAKVSILELVIPLYSRVKILLVCYINFKWCDCSNLFSYLSRFQLQSFSHI